jgi:hypothetical protein
MVSLTMLPPASCCMALQCQRKIHCCIRARLQEHTERQERHEMFTCIRACDAAHSLAGCSLVDSRGLASSRRLIMRVASGEIRKPQRVEEVCVASVRRRNLQGEMRWYECVRVFWKPCACARRESGLVQKSIRSTKRRAADSTMCRGIHSHAGTHRDCSVSVQGGLSRTPGIVRPSPDRRTS